jgi:hypothetical protein
MIAIYLMSQQRPKDTMDFKTTMTDWQRQLGSSGMSLKCRKRGAQTTKD